MTCFSYKHKKTKNTVPTVLSPKPGADPVGGGKKHDFFGVKS